ncbi:hypothetical protein BH23PLA1_BH23PLA1_28650 [soil metagenome]
MRGRVGITCTVPLRRNWRRWTAIVELFARRRSVRKRLGPGEYEAAYRALLAACRDRAAAAEGPEQAYFETLEDLVRPWLTTHSLARADREILNDLVQRCRQFEQELCGRPWHAALADRARKLTWFAMPLALGALVALSWSLGWLPTAPPDDLRVWLLSAWLSIKRLSDLQKLGLIAAAVVLAGIQLVSRTARS